MRMMELFVFAFLLTVIGAQQSQLEGPENTLSFAGSTVTLKCFSPSRNCNGIDWQRYVRGASPVTIFKGPRTILNVAGIDRDRYSVNNSLGCDLVITNVRLTDAGRFICSAIISSSQVTKSANLIILGDQSKCTTTASQNNTADGDRVRMTCGVTYNETNRVSVVWNETTDAPAAVKNGNTISRPYSVVASAPEVPSFTCATSFTFDTHDNGVRIVGLATNTPVTSCETPVIKVMYSVRNVSLSSSLSHNTHGSVIICTATGRPLPTCKWQEMENGSRPTWTDVQNHNGCTFTTPNVPSKWYRCVAMNVVKGRSHSATSEAILVNNTDSDHNDTHTAITFDTIFFGLPLWMWVAVGGGATGLILIVILVICCCVRSCPGYKCCHYENTSDGKIRDEKSLDTYANSTANPKQNVRPKAQPRPAVAAPSVPSNRPPAPLPKNTEHTGNRKAGHNHRA